MLVEQGERSGWGRGGRVGGDGWGGGGVGEGGPLRAGCLPPPPPPCARWIWGVKEGKREVSPPTHPARRQGRRTLQP